MEINAVSNLVFTDQILSRILQISGGRKMALSMASASVSRSMVANVVTVDIPSLDDMKSGKEIYDFWMMLSNMATEKSKSCTALYEELAAKLITLEDSVNHCYSEGDRLKNETGELVGRTKGLEVQVAEAKKDVTVLQATIEGLKRKLESLNKEKKAYDIISILPIGAVIAKIVSAIRGVEEDLSRKQREIKNRQGDLSGYFDELSQCCSELSELKRKILHNDLQIQNIETQRESYQVQRDVAAEEMIQWKNREQYYLNIAGEMEHLIAIEADVSEFKKFIIDNPPKFQLTA